LTGLSFLVKSPNENEVLHFSERKFSSQYNPQDLLVALKAEIENEPLLKACTEITVIYAHSTYTLVPDTLFDETKLSEYLKFNTKILAGDFIAYDTVDEHKIHVVYVPLVNVNNYFFDTFGSFQYYHATTLLLQQLLKKEQSGDTKKVYVHVGRDEIDLVLIDSGALVLCNTYPYRTPEDLAYYVLFAFEQLKWSPESVETVLLGAVSEDDATYAILYTYIRNISVGYEEASLSIDGTDAHQYFLLKNT
jgi:hypothetical protein|tara:strand:- start:1267 stop:2013 length:747 start_codon:yes stop_codon:yes gene_type:complete